MERAARLDRQIIFAIGNAPTALIRLHEMMQEGIFRPDFVIGVPVGFVNVIRYQKDLRLREYDDIARELFVAAQNHLTANEAAGNWNYKKLQESAGETVLGKDIGKDIDQASFTNNLLSSEGYLS